MFVKKLQNSKVDIELFKNQLGVETELLEQWFVEHLFQPDTFNAGAEIEFLLLDQHYQLLPKNQMIIDKVNTPGIIAEAGASQLEINTRVLHRSGSFLSDLYEDISAKWNKCRVVAEEQGYHLALIGSMPNAATDVIRKDYTTKTPDYDLMSEFIRKYHGPRPLMINLKGGKEHLALCPESLSLEGLICSFQLHLEISEEMGADAYNIVQQITAPVLALSSNAPYFLGKNVWTESRIGVFEQLYRFPSPWRQTVFFEQEAMNDSLFSLFKSNLHQFPFLMPEVDLLEPQDHMYHVRRQNSCIFRWNRPILDFNSQKKPFLRIEHRALSTGPTVVDMVANAAFFYGIVHFYLQRPHLREKLPSASACKNNFYQAAILGLDAHMHWKNRHVPISDVLHELIPKTITGLGDMGIDSHDAKYYLHIIQRRVEKRQNGAIWQQKFIEQYGKNFSLMLEHFIANQNLDIPVSDWQME